MMNANRFGSVACFCLVLSLLVVASPAARAEDSIRSQAVVNLTFDEVTGDAYDSAAAGFKKDNGRLTTGAERVESPFWNQRGKGAIRFDAGRKGTVEVPDSGDIFCPDGLSLSFFYINLHGSNDAAAHGIVAKRNDELAASGFGINYVTKSDIFQIYVHHGSGFRIATYSAKEVIGVRRRVFLTATLEAGDAPGEDEDSEADDLLIRLYVNGRQAKPTKVVDATQVGDDVWLTDFHVAGLLNTLPLVLGATNTKVEHTSGVIDEFSLFSRALTPGEVASLFTEVAGANGIDLAAKERQQPSVTPEPSLTSVSTHGLQIGRTTRLTIDGKNLTGDPRVELPIPGATKTIVDGSTANRLVVDISLPGDASPGFYPLCVQTLGGVTRNVVLAVDHLPQYDIGETSPETPALLPAAFSGVLSGSDQARVFFRGEAGQRVVVDVEAKRLGSKMDPVLEIKTDRGTPLMIAWGKTYLGNDARAEVVLPSDGVYYVELHDLVYKAPGRNPFRLRLGDLRVVDTWFPPAVSAGKEVILKPIGPGLQHGTALSVKLDGSSPRRSELVSLPPYIAASGPAPVVQLSDNIEVIETTSADDSLQTIDARFGEVKHVPIVVNGRISEPDERDRYLLDVTPGAKLNLSVRARRTISSPLDGQLLVLKHPEGNILARSDDGPGTRDPGLEYTVPEGVEKIQVSVGDLHNAGGEHYLYRLRIVPSGQPDFELSVNESRVRMAADGSVLLRVDTNRKGYGGPIQLSIVGDENITVSPAELPAAGNNRKVFVTLSRRGGGEVKNLRQLKLVGETVGFDPPVRRVARISSSNKGAEFGGFDDRLAVALTGEVGVSVHVAGKPTELWKGVNARIALRFEQGNDEERALRLTLMSLEKPRRVDSKNAGKGNKPLVRSLPEQYVATTSRTGVLNVAVPTDVAEGAIEFVIRAELVPRPYSSTVLQTLYTAPFRQPVKAAVSVRLDEKTFNLKAGANRIVGTVKRTGSFKGAVRVVLNGLPEGYSSSAATVPGDKDQFEIFVQAKAEEAARDLGGVKLRVSAAGGGLLLPDRGVALKVAAVAKKAEEEKAEEAKAE